MARVTVEDCVVRIPNRFDLVMLAGQRARDISSGAPLTVERDNDKAPVVALREIADETINIEDLAEALIRGMQRQIEVDEPEEDMPEFDVPSFTPDGTELDPTEALSAALASQQESAEKGEGSEKSDEPPPEGAKKEDG